MHRAIVTVILLSVAFPAVGSEPRPRSTDEVVANAFTVGTIYTFAVMRNGAGFCLPPEDRGVDLIWKAVADDPHLFKDVKFEANRIPEEAFSKFLKELFPCR